MKCTIWWNICTESKCHCRLDSAHEQNSDVSTIKMNILQYKIYASYTRRSIKLDLQIYCHCLVLQGSGDEEDLDEDDSLSEDTGSELQDELMDDSEYSEKKSQPPTPSPSPPETPRPTRRRRKARSPSCSDDENRPPSPKVTLGFLELLDNNVIFNINLQQWFLTMGLGPIWELQHTSKRW